MATLFTRIINHEVPGTFVWRDEQCVAFLSINPLAHGHTLIVPIEEVDHWVDATPALVTHLFDVTHTIGSALERAFDPARVGVIIAGYEIPHAHIHVVPTNDMSQLNFANAELEVDRFSLEAAASSIRQALRANGHEDHVVD